jgi:ABC-type glutathione transport system ATPase component
MVDETASGAAPALLRACNLTKAYVNRGNFFGAGKPIRALQDVSLSLSPGKTVGLVGESGCGKSTLAQCLACLLRPDSGDIFLEGENLLTLPDRRLRTARRQVQLVLQSSAASLNPDFSAFELIEEPLVIAGRKDKRERRQQALSVMKKVGLPEEAGRSRASEFSGGQRQRLALARALMVNPKVLILDESLSGLDVALQARMINLLLDLQASLAISYLFISHDMRLAAHFSDQVAVMHAGRIVEYGNVEEIIEQPQHDHTRMLLAAAGHSLRI